MSTAVLPSMTFTGARPTGPKEGGLVPIIQHGKIKYHICRIATPGRFVFRFDWLYKKPLFADEAARRKMLAKINEIPGVHFDDDVLTKRARIPFEKLTTPDALKKLKEAMAWVILQVNVERAKAVS